MGLYKHVQTTPLWKSLGNAWEMKCKKGILSGFEDQLMSETPLHLRTFIEIPGFEWWF